ncbi:MAG: T9SS type A sorting domain-containing protein [Flavobacteriales bacterium]|nr:T9SS type A sorting domain-containing protein [Flavobacteriales bacterium]
MRLPLLTVISASLCTLTAIAQPGIPDNTFAGDATVVFGNGTDWLFTRDLLVRPNGNIVVVGSRFRPSPAGTVMAYCEIDGDGTVTDDAYFGAEGRVHQLQAAALQADGKVVVAGYSYPTGQSEDLSIELMRIGTDGELDPDFGTDGVVVTDMAEWSVGALDVAVGADGKILVAGSRYGDLGEELIVVRYLADGTVDENGFGTDGIAVGPPTYSVYPNEMVVASNGIIYIAGTTFTVDNVPAIVSFMADGSVNEAFGDLGVVLPSTVAGYAYSTALALEPDGNLLLGVSTDPVELHRFTTDGSDGSGLVSGGHVSTGQFVDPDQAISLLSQPDGRILLAVTTGDQRWKTLRLLHNGAADVGFTTFTSPNVGFPVYMRALALQSDGKVLLGGDGAVNEISAFAVTRLLNELTVGADDLSDTPGAVLVYPNPIASEARFSYTIRTSGSVNIELLNNAGQVVRTYANTAASTEGTYTEVLDLEGIESGVYHLVLTAGSQRATVQVTKE